MTSDSMSLWDRNPEGVCSGGCTPGSCSPSSVSGGFFGTPRAAVGLLGCANPRDSAPACPSPGLVPASRHVCPWSLRGQLSVSPRASMASGGAERGKRHETQGWVHPLLSTIPPWGQAGGSVPTRHCLQTCPSRWGLWQGQHRGCLSPPRAPRLVRGDPGMPKVAGVTGEVTGCPAERVKGDNAKGEVCSLLLGTPQCCHCCV